MKVTFIQILSISFLLGSCSTAPSKEDIILKKAEQLFQNEKFRDSFSLIELVIHEFPHNQKALNLYKQLNNEVGENKLYEWEEEKSRDLTSIYKKLKLVIPKVRFTDESLDSALSYLISHSKELDPEEKGLNVISWLGEDLGELVVTPDENNPFASLDDPIPLKKNNTPMRLINLNADNIPIEETIKYICDQLGYKYKVRTFGITIQINIRYPELDVFFYTIPKGLENVARLEGELNWEEFLKKFDINFPPGSKVKYTNNVRKMIFINAVENNEKLKILIQAFKGK